MSPPPAAPTPDPAPSNSGDRPLEVPRTVLVTGATGKLGTEVCKSLLGRGHRVRATDQRFVKDCPAPLELGDLRDEFFVHRLLRDVDTVVHLGNHPNRFAGPSDQRLLAENLAMNANVFLAASDHGCSCLVFASSVQAALPAAGPHHAPPLPIPYLPMDGAAPSDPRTNPYALSKEFGERLLRLQCAARPELSATALRFPMLPLPWWLERLGDPRGMPRSGLNYGECLTHLTLTDAADLVTRVIERRLPGYHQYFPAVSAELTNWPLRDLLREMYAGVPLRTPIESFTSLVDVSAIERELDWRPTSKLRITVYD